MADVRVYWKYRKTDAGMLDYTDELYKSKGRRYGLLDEDFSQTAEFPMDHREKVVEREKLSNNHLVRRSHDRQRVR